MGRGGAPRILKQYLKMRTLVDGGAKLNFVGLAILGRGRAPFCSRFRAGGQDKGPGSASIQAGPDGGASSEGIHPKGPFSKHRPGYIITLLSLEGFDISELQVRLPVGCRKGHRLATSMACAILGGRPCRSKLSIPGMVIDEHEVWNLNLATLHEGETS